MSALGTTLDECARQLAAQFAWRRGELREVRVLDGRAVRRALVDSPAAAAAFACRQPRGAGVYVTMNAVGVGARDRFASDIDVPVRTRFAIDLDPVRASGAPATDSQVEAARALGAAVVRFLVAHGWPVPVTMDSGNGVHAYWRCALKTESTLPRQLLQALAQRFDTPEVCIDRTVHNPARIMRAAGCWNCKGTATPDAPHRIAGVTDPGERDPRALTDEDLGALLATLGVAKPVQAPGRRTPARHAGAAGPRLDVKAWLSRHGIVHRGARDWPCADGLGTRWVLAACPFDAAHCRGEAVITQAASGAVAFRCQHNGCSAYGWRELRERFDGVRVSALDMFTKDGRTLRAAQRGSHGR